MFYFVCKVQNILFLFLIIALLPSCMHCFRISPEHAIAQAKDRERERRELMLKKERSEIEKEKLYIEREKIKLKNKKEGRNTSYNTYDVTIVEYYE